MSAQEIDEPSPLSSTSSKENTIQPSEAAEHPSIQGQQQPTSAAKQPPRKRRRIIISCTECHRRKQKCDRSLPCANCVSRNKQDSCRYETGAPTVKAAQQEPTPPEQAVGAAAPLSSSSSAAAAAVGTAEPKRRGRVSKYDIDPRLAATASATTPASTPAATTTTTTTGSSARLQQSSLEAAEANNANFGYSATGASTLGLMKRIDDGGESLASMAMGAQDTTAYFGTRERYKSLVRQLPARPYIEKLVDIYFKDFNWQYNVSV